MAYMLGSSEAEKSQLEVILKCAICQDIFKDPRQLKCGHSFCKQCLLGMVEHLQFQEFSCPECKTTFGPQIALQKCDTLDSITKYFKKKKSLHSDWPKLDATQKDSPRRSEALNNKPMVNRMETALIKSGADLVLNGVIAVLLVIILILFFYVNSYTLKNQNLSYTVQKQQTQLHNILVHMSDNKCFQHKNSRRTPSDKIEKSQDSAKPSKQESSFMNLMDKDSASPLLEVSPDLHSVERVGIRLPLPDHPSRFDDLPQILTTPCFSSGVHQWELEAKGSWDIAVAYETISRKGKSGSFGDNKKSWCLTQNRRGDLFAYHNKMRREVSKTLKKDHVKVVVDFGKGTITFSEDDGNGLLYSFGSFLPNEPVCLGFALKHEEPRSRITLLNTW